MDLDIDEKEILALLNLAKDFKKEVTQKGNSSYVRVANKDVALLSLKLLLKLHSRIDKHEKLIDRNRLKLNFLIGSISVGLTVLGLLVNSGGIA